MSASKLDTLSENLRLLREGSSTRKVTALRTMPDVPVAAWAAYDQLRGERVHAVRVSLVAYLGRCRSVAVGAWLVAALDDVLPGVRDAALRGLARQRATEALDRVADKALRDPTWWVRRTALWTALSLAPEASAATFLAALDDPFWRVRHVAIGCLDGVASARFDESSKKLEAHVPTSAAGVAAKRYLEARWTGRETDLPEPKSASRKSDRWWSPDPAVSAARLENEEDVPPAVWVEHAIDPHDSLRLLALRRLRQSGDAAAIGAALRWANDLRVPRAAESVASLARGLSDEALASQLSTLMQTGTSEARHWALCTLALRGLPVDAADLAVCLDDADARVRMMAVHAGAERLDDADGRVREAIAARKALGHQRGEAIDLAALGVEGRRGLVQVAESVEDRDLLRTLADDVDSVTRYAALVARLRLQDVGVDERARRLGDPDPRIRGAMVHPSTASKVLASECDPAVRLAAWMKLRAPSRDDLDAVIASGDAELQARAAKHLDASCDMHLDALLGWLRGRDAKRADCARDALDRVGNLPTRLAERLADPGFDDTLRPMALTLRVRGPQAAERLLDAASAPGLTDALRVHLGALAWTVDDPRVVPLRALPTPPPTRRVDTVSAIPLRPFGRSGLSVSPLAISGVNELAEPLLDRARAAGVNLFFWEQGYQRLGRWLQRTARRDPGVHVVSGTYEASPRAIRRDVERALRATGQERLAAFLLFWVRSPERLSEEALATFEALKREGKVALAGFSTHHRDIAENALRHQPWDVAMLRYSAAHPGAESEVFDTASNHGAAVLTFSALSYGRLLRPATPTSGALDLPTAEECYRFANSHRAVSANIAAPRHEGELVEALKALSGEPLSAEREARLRAHGRAVRDASRAFNTFVRAPVGASLAPVEALGLEALRATDEAPFSEVG